MIASPLFFTVLSLVGAYSCRLVRCLQAPVARWGLTIQMGRISFGC